MIVTITFDHDVRRRSYELIADGFALPQPAERVGSGATRSRGVDADFRRPLTAF
jgi:hypothetical protein